MEDSRLNLFFITVSIVSKYHAISPCQNSIARFRSFLTRFLCRRGPYRPSTPKGSLCRVGQWLLGTLQLLGAGPLSEQIIPLTPGDLSFWQVPFLRELLEAIVPLLAKAISLQADGSFAVSAQMNSWTMMIIP